MGADGILVENTSATIELHSQTQDLQSRVNDDQIGSSGTFKARVRPLSKNVVWLSAKDDSNNDTVWFSLVGAGSVLHSGSNVSDESITLVPGTTDQYDIKIVFSGGMPQTGLRWALGASTGSQVQKYAGAGENAIQILRAQFFQGSSDVEYAPTTDLQTYADLQTADGSQDFTLPASNPPRTVGVDHIESLGDNGLITPDFTYDLGDFTVSALVTWNGGAGLAKVIWAHWDGGTDNSSLLVLNTDGKVNLLVSGDGSTIHKNYVSVKALDLNTDTLVSFTWDGTSLKMYINDVELTGAEIDKTGADLALSGDLHNSATSPGGIDAFDGKAYEIRVYSGAGNATDISNIASEFGVSGLPGGGGPPPPVGGDVPTTRAEMETVLTNNFGIPANQIFYVDNSVASSGDGSFASPWKTIQEANTNLNGGQGCIISGNASGNPRFYEQVNLAKSGSAGNPIVFAGNPEAPVIIDASEPFDVTWTNQGTGGGSGNRWRASYGRTRADVPDASFEGNCTLGVPECADYSHTMSHQLIYNDQQLFVHQNGSYAVGAPGAMEEGECYFEVGTGSRQTPQYVWVRLPSDVDPNSVSSGVNDINGMRIASDKKWLWDWGPENEEWTQGYPGGNFAQKANGRSYWALLNVHFAFGSTIRKLGMVSIRGQGNHMQWCSVRDSKHYGIGLHGQDHTLINNKFVRNGQGGMRVEWLHENGGTETLIEDCQYIDNNFQECARRWEAGNKFTDCMAFGTVIMRRCLILREKAYGIWWDIFNGNTNSSAESFIMEYCIIESCWDGGAFFEHNSRKILFRHTGIFDTQAKSYKNTILGTAFRCQAAGDNQIVNCAIVYNDGKAMYFKNHDGRGQANNDNIINNVIGFNCRDTNVEVLRVEHLGGDGYDDSPTCTPFGPAWSSSDIDDNVFFETQGTEYFARDQNCNSFERTDSLSTYQGWHGGSGNVIEASASSVVEDHTDRKSFWKTVGSYTSKGPQGLIHPEDIPAQQWTIPV